MNKLRFISYASFVFTEIGLTKMILIPGKQEKLKQYSLLWQYFDMFLDVLLDFISYDDKRNGNTPVFYKQHIFLSNARLKFAKNQAKPKHHLEAELLLFENYTLSSSTL